MIAMPIPTMITAAAAAIPIALPDEIPVPEPVVDVAVDGATVWVWVAVVVFAPGVVSGPPSAVVVVLDEIVADVLDADDDVFCFAACATAGRPTPGPAASASAASAAPSRRTAQCSDASGCSIAGVSWSVR
jgi:hypothetical protein